MLLKSVGEHLARTTSRRRLFGRGAELAFGALIGVAAGSGLNARVGSAGVGSVCIFPGPPCPCAGCQSSGVCAKPCVIDTTYYSTGCWVKPGDITCCDCNCGGRVPGAPAFFDCGCGTDFHNNPAYCP